MQQNLDELPSERKEELAEFIGIMLGDGHMYELPEKGEYQIRIFGHKTNDYEYLTKTVSRMMVSLFGIEPRVCTREGEVLFLSKQNRETMDALKRFGLKVGNKTLNGSAIPHWIFENKQYLKACLRGLIDTDGSICPKTKRHKTPSIWFSSASPGIRDSFTKALKILGYRVSKWVIKKGRNCQDCSIGNAKDVLRFYQEIGFSNPRNEKRFKAFWRAPMV